ncbi:hypothetical protein FOA52_000009 [Chlamydomonas sp. UWO 241]|nr:hypothetical protein FOA52_000009 [Chlamydomonas sp. UWO 241]
MLAPRSASCVSRAPASRFAVPSASGRVACRALGADAKDAAGSWLDLTKLVTGGGGKKSPYDELASEIGKQIYVDLAGWHLYSRDMTATQGMKMDQALARQLGPKAAERLRESDIEAVLKKIPIKAGAGKLQVSLFEIMPSMCVGDLTRIVEDYGKR